MAISMVRKPSETSNITNIDDIIPFRYAYSNQNGYVIGKGTELSYTINANTFRVNSGRVVLQGVESDVDANGVELVVDIASETRYYVVYYQVNLATNSTNILLSNYDTAGYPTIDLGDDLTVNSSGIARLPLYRFSVANGVIGNIEKVVLNINYAKDVQVENAKAVNGLVIKEDEHGTIKVRDEIISKKRIVWKGEWISGNGQLDLTLTGLKANDKIEIVIETYNSDGYKICSRPYIFILSNGLNKLSIQEPASSFGSSSFNSIYSAYIHILYINIGDDTIYLSSSPSDYLRIAQFTSGGDYHTEVHSDAGSFKVLEIYQIIE